MVSGSRQMKVTSGQGLVMGLVVGQVGVSSEGLVEGEREKEREKKRERERQIPAAQKGKVQHEAEILKGLSMQTGE